MSIERHPIEPMGGGWHVSEHCVCTYSAVQRSSPTTRTRVRTVPTIWSTVLYWPAAWSWAERSLDTMLTAGGGGRRCQVPVQGIVESGEGFAPNLDSAGSRVVSCQRFRRPAQRPERNGLLCGLVGTGWEEGRQDACRADEAMLYLYVAVIWTPSSFPGAEPGQHNRDSLSLSQW